MKSYKIIVSSTDCPCSDGCGDYLIRIARAYVWDVRLTLYGISRMRFRLGHGLRRSDHYVLNVCHCVDESVD